MLSKCYELQFDKKNTTYYKTAGLVSAHYKHINAGTKYGVIHDDNFITAVNKADSMEKIHHAMWISNKYNIPQNQLDLYKAQINHIDSRSTQIKHIFWCNKETCEKTIESLKNYPTVEVRDIKTLQSIIKNYNLVEHFIYKNLPIVTVDILKYELVYHLGGMVADLDFLFIDKKLPVNKAPDTLLQQDTFFARMFFRAPKIEPKDPGNFPEKFDHFFEKYDFIAQASQMGSTYLFVENGIIAAKSHHIILKDILKKLDFILDAYKDPTSHYVILKDLSELLEVFEPNCDPVYEKTYIITALMEHWSQSVGNYIDISHKNSIDELYAENKFCVGDVCYTSSPLGINRLSNTHSSYDFLEDDLI